MVYMNKMDIVEPIWHIANIQNKKMMNFLIEIIINIIKYSYILNL